MEKEGAGGRKFLPMPIFAAVMFLLLAIGTRYVPHAASPEGPELIPTVGELRWMMQRGQLEDAEYYTAQDTLDSATVEEAGLLDDLVVRFASLPGTPFRMRGYGSVYEVEEMANWTIVYAVFQYTAGDGLALIWFGGD